METVSLFNSNIMKYIFIFFTILFIISAQYNSFAKNYFTQFTVQNNIIPESNSIMFENNKNDSLARNTNEGTAAVQPATSGRYTKEQDSIFDVDTRLSLPFLYMLKKAFDMTDSYWYDWMREIEMQPDNALRASFEKMPTNIFEPTKEERVQYAINQQMAFASVPTVSPNFMGNSGTNFNLQEMGRFLGLIEDVSPVITYNLAITADVEVVVYSISAKVVATIFSGTQKPGKYTFHWNGRDDSGKKMPSGDYIAEVKIGAERFVRKRIVIE